MRTGLLRSAALLLAALGGGGVAVGIGAAVWDGGSTTTVVREVQGEVAPAPATFGNTGNGETIQRLYRNAAPAVVQVISTQVTTDNPSFGPQEARALGSGFVIDKVGHIVTNFHVVQDAKEVHVSFSGRDQIPAKVVGVDPSTDLAVLSIDAKAQALTTLPLGDSDKVQVGDSVVAIGNPLGLDRTITAGIVSALQREITSPNGFAIDHVIQTDAAINHGNSGGPLLNTRGEVIGVNSQIATGGSDPNAGNIGIGFAVPIDTVKDVVSQILQTGRVEHAFLGISMQDVDRTLTDNFKMPADHGVLIISVRPGSPAAKAGLRGGRTNVVVNGQSYTLGGDVVTKVDGKPVTSADEIRSVVQSKKPGDAIRLEIHRDKTVKTLTITLGRQPSAAAG